MQVDIFGSNPIQQFLKESNYNILDEDTKNRLDQPITDEEIGKALFELNNDSTPGLDGITTSWYKVFFNKIRCLLFSSFQYCLSIGELGMSQRLGVVSLLHKGKELRRDLIKNWRPITITNTDYKILSKVLARRIQTVLDFIISPNQSGFMKGRNISDHIRLIDDAINLSDKFNNPGMLVSLDFEKAFDSISNSTILSALKIFNFGDSFIHMVQTLTNKSESCILNLGWLSGFYNTSETGVKQGCCLSPLLFIVCVELMAIRLRNDQHIKGLEFQKFGYTTEPLKILQYCDDTSLFLGSVGELNAALEIIEEFYKISGLKLNRQKSIGIGIGATKEIEGNPGNISWKRTGETIKILGIHFASNKEASDLEINWVPKLEKVSELSGRLLRRHASLWGRIMLCKTFLLSQLSFAIQSLSIPEKYAEQLDSILFQFIWKKHGNKKVIEKIKRKVMCMEKERGGASMIRISSQQKVFLAKWIMKIENSTKQSQFTISKIPFIYINHFSGPNVFFNFSCVESDIAFPYYFSRFWRDAIKAWLILKSRIKILEKNENFLNILRVSDVKFSYLFHNDNIVFRGRSFFFKKWIETGYLQVKDVLDGNNSFVTWEKLPGCLTTRPACLFEFNTLKVAVENFLKTKKSYCSYVENSKLTNLKNYIMRNIFEANYNQAICGYQFWKRKLGIEIFDLYASSLVSTKETKLKVFLFKIFHNILPSRILLKKFNIVDSDKCDCGLLDHIEHSLVSCPMLIDIWKEVNQMIVNFLGKSLHLNLENKIFGLSISNGSCDGLSVKQVQKINIIILLAKFAIVKAKAQKSTNFVLYFEEEVNFRKILS